MSDLNQPNVNENGPIPDENEFSEMVFKCTTQIEDAAKLYYCKSFYRLRPTYRIAGYFIAVFFFSIILWRLISVEFDFFWFIVLLFIPYIFITKHYVLKVKHKKKFKSLKPEELEYELTISRDGVRTKSTEVDVKVGWKLVEGLALAPGVMAGFLASDEKKMPEAYFMLPERYYNEEQKNAIIKLFKEKGKKVVAVKGWSHKVI